MAKKGLDNSMKNDVTVLMGDLTKMPFRLDDQNRVHYSLLLNQPDTKQSIDLNERIGQRLTLTHTGIIHCSFCGKVTKKSFQGFSRGAYENVEVGGKTGSLSGLNPKGRYDWFIGYAQLGDKKLAFASLCINEAYWYVKSSYIARKAVEHFFKLDQT